MSNEKDHTAESHSSDTTLLWSVTLIALTLLVLGSFLLYQAISERTQLRDMKESQEKPLQQAELVKKQLDGIASDTAKLALAGHSEARQILAEMERSGIRVSP